MLLWGASAYLSALVPRHLSQVIGRRLQSFSVVAAAVAVATTAATLLIETAVIGEGWGDALDPAIIRDVLLSTSVGQAWQVQAVAALILMAMFAVPTNARQGATALGSGFFLSSIALTGHAVMLEGGLGVAERVNDAVHVLCGGAWLGALVPFFFILRRLGREEDRREAGLALMRFSTAGHLVVVLVVASGVINTILTLGSWPADWSSPYQALLASKIGMVTLMVGLATVNRYAFVPWIARNRSGGLRAIKLGTVTEIVLGLAVVGLVSVFGILDPT